MPLTRYEIRNEYSLANPDLYRAAAKDDPEGLLEGVAMAGLVGIVRQLGDLAEFAAEVFHDLHEEVLATASRGHELLIRVQQLEAELPLVERMMVAESNCVNFSYNPGVEWHANIHNDQNHFTQGDLPRFIRNAYEDCRGPPRLFLLDKFDVAGAGACLKRYTDPSFFRMEWASSELMKAEKEQQDKRARRNKKKGRRQRNGEIRDSFRAAHLQPRMHHVSSEVENTASTSVRVHNSTPQDCAQQEGAGSKFQVHEQQPASSRLSILEQEGLNPEGSTSVLSQDVKFKEVSSRLSIPEPEGSSLKASIRVLSQDAKPEGMSVELTPGQDPELNEASMKSSDPKPKLAMSNSAEMKVAGNGPAMPTNMKVSDDVADDFASETDNYMDALTTMDSEVETDLEVKAIADLDGESGLNAIEGKATLETTTTCLKSSGVTHIATVDDALSTKNSLKESTVLERIEPEYVVSSRQADFTKEREPILLDDIGACPSIQQRSFTPLSGSSSSSSPSENSVTKSEVLKSESAEGIPETSETPKADESETLQLENLTSVFEQLPEPAVPLGNGLQTVSPEHFGSMLANLGVKTSALVDREFSSARVVKHSFEDSESEASEGGKDKHSFEDSEREASEGGKEKHCFEDSESEASEGIKELSPQSSANSSIQSMKWDIDFSKHSNNVLDSDDELEGMQVSSSSSTSSALSSPRPSTLATTIFNKDFDNKPSLLLSSQGSIKSSSESLLGLSPHSAGRSAPHSPISLMETGVNPSIISPRVVQASSHVSSSQPQLAPDHYTDIGFESMLHTDVAVPAQNQSLLADESEHFPPLPPLPPLEWRMTKRSSGILSSSTKTAEFSAGPPNLQIPLSRPPEFSQAFNPFTFNRLAPQNSYAISDEPMNASKPSTSWNSDSQGFSMKADELEEPMYASKLSTSRNKDSQGFSMNANELEELSDEDPSAPKNVSEVQEMPMQASNAFSVKLPSPFNIPERPEQLSQSLNASKIWLAASNEVPMKVPEASTKGHSISQSFTRRPYESLQSYRSFTTESVDDVHDDSIESSAWVEDRNAEGFSPPSELYRSNPATARRNKIFIDRWDDNGVELLHPPLMDEKVSLPARLEEVSEDLQPPLLSPGLGSHRVSRPTSERKDPLIAAIASHDKSSLRKVPEGSQSLRTPHTDDREGLLEQIRTKSFSLRHTNVQKQETPRPVTSVNVAAILEKANAIRQAFAGSDEDDEDDDWSD